MTDDISDTFDFGGLLDDLPIGAATAIVAPAPPATAPAEKPRRTKRTPVTRGKGPLYLDIETIPDLSRESSFGLDPLPNDKPEDPPDNLMDAQEFLSQSIKEMEQWAEQHNPPESWIAGIEDCELAGKKRKGVVDLIAGIRKTKGAFAEAHADRMKLLSTTPEYCRIVAIAAAMGTAEPKSEFAVNEEQERLLLASFWTLMADYAGPVVVFNGLRFDLPVIFVRSAMLGIEPTRRFDMRPWGTDVIDLYAARFPPGSSNPMGQKKLTAALQIEDAETDQDDDGSQVYAQFCAGEYDKIINHVTKDIVRLRGLHAMYQGFFCN